MFVWSVEAIDFFKYFYHLNLIFSRICLIIEATATKQNNNTRSRLSKNIYYLHFITTSSNN